MLGWHKTKGEAKWIKRKLSGPGAGASAETARAADWLGLPGRVTGAARPGAPGVSGRSKGSARRISLAWITRLSGLETAKLMTASRREPSEVSAVERRPLPQSSVKILDQHSPVKVRVKADWSDSKFRVESHPLNVQRTKKTEAASPCASVATSSAPADDATRRQGSMAAVDKNSGSACEMLTGWSAVRTGPAGTVATTADGNASTGAAMSTGERSRGPASHKETAGRLTGGGAHCQRQVSARAANG